MPLGARLLDALLVDLDEDIRDYIIDMLGGDETEEEMKAAVTEFLVSTEHCADEDEATAKYVPSEAEKADMLAQGMTDPTELRMLELSMHLFRPVGRKETEKGEYAVPPNAMVGAVAARNI